MADYTITEVDADNKVDWKDGPMADYPIKVEGSEETYWVAYPQDKAPKVGQVLQNREEYTDKFTGNLKLKKSSNANPATRTFQKVIEAPQTPSGESKPDQEYWEAKDRRIGRGGVQKAAAMLMAGTIDPDDPKSLKKYFDLCDKLTEDAENKGKNANQAPF